MHFCVHIKVHSTLKRKTPIMNFDLKTLDLAAAASEKCDLLVVLLPEGFKPGKDALSALAALALKNGDLATKAGKHLQLYQVPAVAARRVVLVGQGDGSARATRQALQAVGGAVKAPQTKRVVLCFAGAVQAASVSAAVQAVAEVSYVYTTTKTKVEARSLSRCVVGVPTTPDVREDFDAGVALVAGVEFAREWGNRPANHATPTLLADAAKTLSKLPRIQCKVHGPAEVARLCMGAFLAVARGSEEPLRFIELRYNGAAKDQAPVVLVGKGITFDTGGISIKPAPEMDEMKFDMCGAASVPGTFRALGELQPSINVVGLIPACESAQDPCWRMPLDDDYADGLKSNFADMGNVAGRAGGSITAAKFLQKFVGDMPWAHLDIAGTAWKGGAAKGATGRPVGLLVHYLMGQAIAAKPVSKPAAAKRSVRTKTA